MILYICAYRLRLEIVISIHTHIHIVSITYKLSNSFKNPICFVLVVLVSRLIHENNAITSKLSIELL